MATHKDALGSIPDLKTTVVDLRVGMERLSTTIKMAGGLAGLLISGIEIAHLLLR